MVLNASGKLIGHLCRHERMRDVLALKILVQRHEVETQLLRNDVKRSATGQCGVHVHHAGIEAVAGVCCHLMLCLQVIIAMVPMDESYHVAMNQLATLGHARRA